MVASRANDWTLLGKRLAMATKNRSTRTKSGKKLKGGRLAKSAARGRTSARIKVLMARAAKRRSGTPAEPGKVRILVADQQTMDRHGLVSMLNNVADFEVIGEAVTAEEAVRRCRESSPSVVLLALHLPAPEGATALSALRAAAPKVPILAIAERSEGQCMVLNPPRSGRFAPLGGDAPQCTSGTDCLQLAVLGGATGTIRRSAEPDELFRAIRTVASGQAWYESGTASAIMRHALAYQGSVRRANLSDRETEVAELIADGRSNKEIAQALNISEPTVKKHVGHILGKLRLQDRLQIGLYVARNPLVLRRSESGHA